MLIAWAQFLAVSMLIAAAGFSVVYWGDVIGEKTGLGGAWIGLVLIATVTSLPELVTGLSAVTVAHAPDIAVGDALGSCVFNLLLIALLDFLHRGTPLYLKTSDLHILSAGFCVVLHGLVVFSIVLGDADAGRIGHVGVVTPILFALYLIAARAIYVRGVDPTRAAVGQARYEGLTLRRAVAGYAGSGLVVVAAGIALPITAVRLAEQMGWGQTFVGTTLVAMATSIPEAASTLGALRIGAIDLAISNLLGSNLFNMLVLAIDDLAYLEGPLLASVTPHHALSGISAIIMTGIAIVGLYYRPRRRLFHSVGWASLALVVVYVLNTLVLYLKTH